MKPQLIFNKQQRQQQIVAILVLYFLEIWRVTYLSVATLWDDSAPGRDWPDGPRVIPPLRRAKGN